ncbi:MAG: HlyD family secretion protein [Acidocella sp.]|nr:HlyD family secretion protein [Acidocella sp.]
MADVNASKIMPRWALLSAAIFIIAVLLAWIAHYLLVGQYFVSTDDAYVAADSSLIAAKVSGYVTEVAVDNGDSVQPGQLLAVIDPRDYQNAEASAKAAAVAAQAGLILQQAKVKAAQAALQGDQAREIFAEQNQTRYTGLSAKGASTVQQAEQANTDLATMRAQLDADNANLQAAIAQVDVLTAALARAKAQAAQAALDLGHTEIRAPVAGMVGNKNASVGDYLQPGTQIMAVVPLAQVYVLANYKETQITNMLPGQKVRVHVDGFPGLDVRGHVDAIFPASGQTFALLPPDNATGNFTKIVQRVPVKILLDLTPEQIGKLRPGMSVEPEVDTRGQK